MARKSDFVKKNKAVKVWVITSSILILLALTITMIARWVPFCYNGLNSLFGGEKMILKSGDPSKYNRFVADYDNKEEVLNAANALNEEICEEGIILMKNEDNVLPLGINKKISVFGKNSTNPVMGGSGSSAGMQESSVINFYEALENEGLEYNPALKSFYNSSVSGPKRPGIPTYGTILTGYPISEAPIDAYTESVRNSYKEYSDAALVFISRVGGEGYDLPRTMFWNGSNYRTWTGKQVIPGARSADSHYLQLDVNETNMIKEACDNFDSVVLIINSSSPLELGFLEDPNHYAYNAKLKAALWIGNPGGSGFNSLVRVLKGETNPSGRTVDTYPRNFKADPTWNNFGNNLQSDGNRYTLNGTAQNAYFVEYEEGIYIGYRYYETRGYTDGEDWYEDNVVFPFGYGKSYTTFSQEIVSHKPSVGTPLDGDGQISITVKVSNTGTISGKEVVQLYYTAPYIQGGIEKAHVVLGAFAKTGIIEPGGSEMVTLTLKVRAMASFDYDDANENDFVGYELDAGKYTVKLMRNAHDLIDSISFELEDDIKFINDEATGQPVENLFAEESQYIKKYLSRSDWQSTWPQRPGMSDLTATHNLIDSLNYKINDKSTDEWYSAAMPEQRKKALSYKNTQLKLHHMIDKDYDDTMWNDLINQLTVAQMAELVSVGHFRTIGINNISKPLTTDADGPSGFAAFVNDPTVYNTAYYASSCVLSSTWNIDLAEKFGVMIGNESLIGDERGDGRPYSGWYAPAMNIHRSQFGGRNFEYYSEDGLLSGITASAVIKGADSKGVYTYAKHFALNDQETNRDTNGLITWANEQAMREIYFLPFEIAVKEGKTRAIMSSFNRIGSVWTGGNYKLLTELLRNEWGFEGMVITDFNMSRYMSTDQMIRAGGDISLSISKPITSSKTATEVTSLRRATKNILYTISRSNAMNGMGEGVIYKYLMPRWLPVFIITDIAIFAICCAWGALILSRTFKKK